MTDTDLTKCKNCGAELADNVARCPYCGTAYRQTNASTADTGAENNGIISPADDPAPAEKNDDTGISVVILLIAIIIFIIIGVVLHKNSSSGISKQEYADSLKAYNETINKQHYGPYLEDLTAIKVDSVTFKALYKNARKTVQKAKHTTYIYDPTTPDSANVNNVYFYIANTDTGYRINIVMQYVGKKRLNIEKFDFIIDGRDLDYAWWDLNKGETNGLFWERIENDFTDGLLFLAADLATAKKLKIKYTGDKRSQTVVVTPQEQAAMLRQLQIFKGVASGYTMYK